MRSDVLVCVNGVSKKFCRTLKRSLWYGVQDVAGEIIGREGKSEELRPGEFWSVRDVSFELRRGECLGLIGPNGAGKSTLLKMLNGLIKPDHGSITMRGRVAALIELGAGFNPVLTGRENIYINGSVLGLSKKEIDSSFEAIVGFSELEDFIDMPVQSYSSGMKVRLGFSVAAQLNPDVLLIDEVLAVGDMGFRSKCYAKISDLVKRSAVVFVSHQMPHVSKLCNMTMVLDKSAVIFQGNAVAGIHTYNNLFAGQQRVVSGTGEAEVTNVVVLNEAGSDSDGIFCQEPCRLQFDVKVSAAYKEYKVSVGLVGQDGALVAQCHSEYNRVTLLNTEGWHKISLDIDKMPLNPGVYYFNIIVFDESNRRHLAWVHAAKEIVVKGGFHGGASVQLQGNWTIKSI